MTTGALPERVMPYAKGADVRIAFLPEDMLDSMLWRAAVCRAIEAGAACVRVSLLNGEIRGRTKV